MTQNTSQHSLPATSGDPEYAVGHTQHVPDEILLEILEYLLPNKRGYTLGSGWDDIDFCPTTLTMLLNASAKTRFEVLKRTKEHPIYIRLESGRACECQDLVDRPESILDYAAGLAVAAELPLWAWKEVVVTFSPAHHPDPAHRCHVDLDPGNSPRLQRAVQRPPLGRQDRWLQLMQSVQCVNRQSAALGAALGRLPQNRKNRNRAAFRFVFDGSQGVDEYEDHPTGPRGAVWDLKLVREALSAWRWITFEEGMPAIKFPSSFTVGVDHADGGYFDQEGNGDALLRFYRETIAWWKFERPEFGRYIWAPEDTDRGYEESYSDALYYMGPLQVTLVTFLKAQIQWDV